MENAQGMIKETWKSGDTGNCSKKLKKNKQTNKLDKQRDFSDTQPGKKQQRTRCQEQSPLPFQ